VLRLRALRSSNDFNAYWEFHEQQEYERHHASHYADHRVPETLTVAPKKAAKMAGKRAPALRLRYGRLPRWLGHSGLARTAVSRSAFPALSPSRRDKICL
jgi:hypothetical protein